MPNEEEYLNALPILVFKLSNSSIIFKNRAVIRLESLAEALATNETLLQRLQTAIEEKLEYIILDWGSFHIFTSESGTSTFTEVSRSRLEWSNASGVNSKEVSVLEMCSMSASTCAWVNQLPIAIFRVDKDFKFIFSNKSFNDSCSLLENSERNFCDYIHEADLPELEKLKLRLEARVKLGGNLKDTIEEIEFRWKPTAAQTAKNEDKWTFARIVIEVSSNGESYGYLGIISNRTIAKLKEAEVRIKDADLIIRNLRKCEEEEEMLSEWSTSGLSRLSLEGKIITVNSAWKKIVGLDSDYDSWPKLLAEAGKEELIVAWNSFITLQSSSSPSDRLQFEKKTFNSIMRTKSGQSLLVTASLNNRKTGFFVSVVDLTEQELAREDEARLSDERLRGALEEKQAITELVHTVSHEIRSPTSSIINNSVTLRASLDHLRDLISTFALPESASILRELQLDIDGLDSISYCARIQARVADDILGLASIQLTRYSITPTVTDLASLRQTIIHNFENEARTKKIKLSFKNASTPLPESLLVDQVRLSQILINLISNALRFTSRVKERRVVLKLDVSTARPVPGGPLLPPSTPNNVFDPDAPIYIYFSCADTGLGMTGTEISKLFRYLSQASPTTHASYSGSGLGLWICRKLTTLMNGEIEVVSQPGVGSTFRGYIEGAAYILPTRPVKTLIRSDSNFSNSGPSLRVLVVEDNQISSTILRRQLERAGHVVTVANDGSEGIAKIEETEGLPFDVILMDFEMPEICGLSATRIIRASEIGKKNRIIGLTGNVLEKELGLQSGMDLVLTKPYDIKELLAVLVLNSPLLSPTESDVISYLEEGGGEVIEA